MKGLLEGDFALGGAEVDGLGIEVVHGVDEADGLALDPHEDGVGAGDIPPNFDSAQQRTVADARCAEDNAFATGEASSCLPSDLTTLWKYLCTYDDPAAHGTAEPRNRFPSMRKLARQLEIPRGKMPALFKELKSMVSVCQDIIAGDTAVGGRDAGDGIGRG